MSSLIKIFKNKIATGALIGSLLGGVTPTIIQSYLLPDDASITAPITLDDVNAYEITTQKFNVQKLSNSTEIINEELSKEYKDIKNITNFNNNYTSEKNSINLVISSPWIINEDLTISRTNYCYSTNNENLTTEEVKKIIEIFKSGEIKQIINNINFESEYKEYATSNENLENYSYLAELTVKTIDSSKIYTIKQDKIENIVETLLAGATGLIGLRLGIHVGNICDNKKNTSSRKVKKLKKNKS